MQRESARGSERDGNIRRGSAMRALNPTQRACQNDWKALGTGRRDAERGARDGMAVQCAPSQVLFQARGMHVPSQLLLLLSLPVSSIGTIQTIRTHH